MLAVTGIFRAMDQGAHAADRLVPIVGEKRVSLLVPGEADRLTKEVPATEDMAPVGGAIGGVIAGTLGAGLALTVPGVGVVTALGAAAAAVIGAGAGYAGWKLGDAADRESYDGPPIDELYLYEDALAQGRTVLIALVDDSSEADKARRVIAEEGAESVDAARDAWWIGVRDAEAERYEADGGDFATDEAAFRNGFETALRGGERGGKPNGDSTREAYGAEGADAAYQRGFERGFEFRRRRHWTDAPLTRRRGDDRGRPSRVRRDDRRDPRAPTVASARERAGRGGGRRLDGFLPRQRSARVRRHDDRRRTEALSGRESDAHGE
jgi:hypothetical protein